MQEPGREYYLVTISKFGPKQEIEVEESDWEAFMPRAVEIQK